MRGLTAPLYIMKKIGKRLLKKKAKWCSGYHLDSKEVDVLKRNDYECWQCGKDLIDTWDMSAVRGKECYCEECYTEQFFSVCNVCEDYYENIDYPVEDEHIYIGKELSKEVGYTIGIYKVLSKPYFYGDCITGFDNFFDNSLGLIKAIDLDVFYSFLYRQKSEITAGNICPTCVARFTQQGYIKPVKHYNSKTNEEYIAVHRSINQRAIIKGAKI